MAEQGGLRNGMVENDEKGLKSGVKDSNKIVEELARGMKSKQVGRGFRVVEGEDYEDVIEKTEKSCMCKNNQRQSAYPMASMEADHLQTSSFHQGTTAMTKPGS